MYRSLKYSILLLTVFIFSGCSNYFYKKANKEFANLQYFDAITHYKKSLSKKENRDAKIKLANSYRLVNDVANAEPLFSEIVNYLESEPINMFYYAKILMSHGNYNEAKVWLKKYLEKVPTDIVAQMLLASCNSVNQFMRDTTLYTLEQINFPEFESAFGQVPYKDGVVFTADKKVKLDAKQDEWTGKSYYDLYFAEKDKDGHWLSPQLLKGEINGRYHEGPATFNKAGDVAYFTRSNYFKYNLRKSAKDENNLKLFKAKLVDGKWKQLEELPFNSDEYSVGHPSLSSDEKTLYFISDMPGGLGGTDIYRSTFDGAVWSKPENLGNVINTPGNEMFPHMSDDGTLYFSSDAHNNMGGMDVFASSYDLKNKKWLQVENLNYPLNSTKDDFAFVLNADNKTGFVSSNRDHDDKVFEIQKHDPTFWLTGVVTIKGKNLPFEDVTITLIDETNDSKNAKFSVQTDKNGKYKIKLKPNSDFIVYGSKENYFTQSVDLSTKGKKFSEDYTVNFQLDEIIIEKPIVLENIYYDLDKSEIRPDAAAELDKLVKLLNDNPNVNIEMGSHTDARAGDHYNLVLSDKRAKSTVDYLVFKGIDVKRLKYKGYGETKLINRCKNDVECTEEEHQQNRRTEFKVTKITKK